MKKKPTGKTARTRTKPEKRTTPHADNARNVGARILSLWYHCAEVKYHIPNDKRFDFDCLYRQEIARFKHNGITQADIIKGCKLAFSAYKKLEAGHKAQLAQWEKCLSELRAVRKILFELDITSKEYARAMNNALTNVLPNDLIEKIQEPDELQPRWFMDSIYRDTARTLKTIYRAMLETRVCNWVQDRDEKSNPDLMKIAEARRHGIKVKLSGASYENALRFWDETGRIAHEGLVNIPRNLTGDNLDAEASKRIALIEADIDKAQKRYAEDSRHIPESKDFERALEYAVERAGAEGTTARAMARSAAHILSEAATLRGEELRKHQRERAAELVLQDGLEIGRAAREYGNELTGEATRGGYKDALSLEQGLRRHATELGIADKIIKGKRGRHKTA